MLNDRGTYAAPTGPGDTLHIPVSVAPDGRTHFGSSLLQAPSSPGSPASPSGPLAPVSPFSPVSPFGPWSPFGPVGPAGPAGPAGPRLPANLFAIAVKIGRASCRERV